MILKCRLNILCSLIISNHFKCWFKWIVKCLWEEEKANFLESLIYSRILSLMWTISSLSFCISGKREKFIFAPWSIYVDLLRSLYIKVIYCEMKENIVKVIIYWFIYLILCSSIRKTIKIQIVIKKHFHFLARLTVLRRGPSSLPFQFDLIMVTCQRANQWRYLMPGTSRRPKRESVVYLIKVIINYNVKLLRTLLLK